MSDLAFRPRGSAELLDASIRLFRQHAAPLLTLGIVAMLPSIAVTGVMLARFGAELADPTPTLPAGFYALFPLMMLATLWYLVIDGAIVAATSDAYLGREVSAADALRRVVSRAGAVLGSVILKWIVIYAVSMAALLAVAIPAGILAAAGGGAVAAGLGSVVFGIGALAVMLYLVARLFAVPATAVLEDNGAVRALSRASQLAKGSIWRIIKVYLLAFLVLMVLSLVIVVVVSMALAAWPAAQILAMVPYMLVYPLISVVTTLLYYDVRIRREGLDIELMAQRLGGEPAGQPA